MRYAFKLGRLCLPDYASKFSRRDFTLPQLFACLVLGEQLGLSYRGTQALLNDCRHWCRDIGLRRVPDHNTLCRAFHNLIRRGNARRMLDRLAMIFSALGKLGDTLAIDSSLYDTHHRSRHYEQRCRHYAGNEKHTADARRSRSAKRTPKLAIGIDTSSHVVLSAKPRTGMGSDCRDFVPLLYQAWRRNSVRHVLADAGYDSEANHRTSRRSRRVFPPGWIWASAR